MRFEFRFLETHHSTIPLFSPRRRLYEPEAIIPIVSGANLAQLCFSSGKLHNFLLGSAHTWVHFEREASHERG